MKKERKRKPLCFLLPVFTLLLLLLLTFRFFSSSSSAAHFARCYRYGVRKHAWRSEHHGHHHRRRQTADPRVCRPRASRYTFCDVVMISDDVSVCGLNYFALLDTLTFHMRDQRTKFRLGEKVR